MCNFSLRYNQHFVSFIEMLANRIRRQDCERRDLNQTSLRSSDWETSELGSYNGSL